MTFSTVQVACFVDFESTGITEYAKTLTVTKLRITNAKLRNEFQVSTNPPYPGPRPASDD